MRKYISGILVIAIMIGIFNGFPLNGKSQVYCGSRC